MRLRLVATLAAALACACAAPDRFLCPARGGREWRELRSEHFVVRTDLDRKAAAAVLEELESLRTIFLTSMFDRPVSLSDRLEVIVLATDSEYSELTRWRESGGFYQQDVFGRERIVLRGRAGPGQGQIVAHELAHRLAYQFLPRQPRWFSEGIALYFQTAAEPVGAQRRLGTLPGRWLTPLREGPLPVRGVLRWRKEEGEEARYYATSWLLVHYLMNARLDDFAAFQRRLARAEEPQLAWDATFPEWSLQGTGTTEELDARLRAHLQDTTWAFIEVDAPPSVTGMSERILSSPEVHAITLDIGHRRPQAERQADASEALAEDPGHVPALQELAQRERARGPELARRAVEAHGQDARAWSFRADETRTPGAIERRLEARRRAAELEPGQVEWKVRLAAGLLAAGRPDEAEREAARAARMAPWSWPPMYIHAIALVWMKRCSEGILALQRAVDAMAADLTAEEVARKGEAYDRMAKRCAQPDQQAADALFQRGDLLLGEGEDGLAARLLREAVARDPKHDEAWATLGTAELRLGHPASARRAFQRQLELEPEHLDALRELVTADRELHRLDDAEATLRKALALKSPSASARWRLIYLLLDRERPAEALAELDRDKRLAHDVWTWYVRGRAHLMMHEAAKGRSELVQAVSFAPGDPELLDLSARALAEADLDPERAALWEQRARAERKSTAAAAGTGDLGREQAIASRDLIESWTTAGLMALRAGSIGEALRLLGSAERLGGDPKASAWLAQALDQAGRSEEAARARARAVAVAPELRDARRRLAARPDGDALVQAGRADLARVRSLPLPAGAADRSSRDLLVALAVDGTVAGLVARDGGPLPAAVAALKGAAHGIEIPPDAPPLLVLPATASCGAGGCAVVLGAPLGEGEPPPP